MGGLARPAHGHLSFATLSPAALGSAGFGTVGVLAVVAVLGFVGFEQAPVLGRGGAPAQAHGPGRDLYRAGHDRRRLRRGVCYASLAMSTRRSLIVSMAGTEILYLSAPTS